MKFDKSKKSVVFTDTREGDTLTVQYTNRGDPYDEGVELHLAESSFGETHAHVYLERSEALRLAALINDIYGEKS